MSVDIRLLTAAEQVVPFTVVHADLARSTLCADFSLQALFGGYTNWTELDLRYRRGSWVARIQREAVQPDAPPPDSITRLTTELGKYRPDAAVQWLRRYLRTVKAVYTFRVTVGTAEDALAWLALGHVVESLRSRLRGIIQSPQEGFFIEEGIQIAWDPSLGAVEAAGPKKVAELRNGRWVPFEIDMGNPAHQEALARGEIPQDARPWL